MQIGEVAKQLGVTTATIRNWLKIGDRFFSISAQRTRKKQFTAVDLAQLRRIKSLLEDGLLYKDIPRELDPVPQILDDDDPLPFEPVEDVPMGEIAPIEFFEHFRLLLETQKEQFEETARAKDALIGELKADKERLQAELDRLRAPWWRRWFRPE